MSPVHECVANVYCTEQAAALATAATSTNSVTDECIFSSYRVVPFSESMRNPVRLILKFWRFTMMLRGAGTVRTCWRSTATLRSVSTLSTRARVQQRRSLSLPMHQLAGLLAGTKPWRFASPPPAAFVATSLPSTLLQHMHTPRDTETQRHRDTESLNLALFCDDAMPLLVP